jgi:hypothetical protein
MKEGDIMKPVISVIVFLLVVVFVFLISIEKYNHLFFNTDANHHVQSIHEATIIILTFVLACIAWIQLGGIKKTTQAEFLLRIDERLGDENIIHARKIIHNMYLESKNACPNCSEQGHRYFIAYKIDEISSIKDKSNDYVDLLNFLDFLETISLFTNMGYITESNVKNSQEAYYARPDLSTAILKAPLIYATTPKKN